MEQSPKTCIIVESLISKVVTKIAAKKQNYMYVSS